MRYMWCHFSTDCSDTEKIQSGIGDKAAIFLQNATSFVVCNAIAFHTSQTLSFVLTAMMPLMGIMTAVLAKVS